VFGATPYSGNPLGVVVDATGLTVQQMQRLASWANLSETTFLFPPTVPAANYRVRIFTPTLELPFAGHPTLGSAHVWLSASGYTGDVVVQECPAGLVPVRRSSIGLSFQAPPLVRSGPVGTDVVERVAAALNVDVNKVVDAQWVDNGPGWVALMLQDAQSVLAVRPGPMDFFAGVVGFYPAGSECAYEMRAFFPKDGATAEDPVTGSLNASVAQWLVANGTVKAPTSSAKGRRSAGTAAPTSRRPTTGQSGSEARRPRVSLALSRSDGVQHQPRGCEVGPLCKGGRGRCVGGPCRTMKCTDVPCRARVLSTRASGDRGTSKSGNFGPLTCRDALWRNVELRSERSGCSLGHQSKGNCT
jgi:PhzF family phenazine biosynthesis protein